MRGSQQRKRGIAAELRRCKLDDEVESCRYRFGCERQRVDRLIRHAGATKNLAGQIEIRERTLEGHSNAIETRRRSPGTPGYRDELLFPVAFHKRQCRRVSLSLIS